MKKIYLTLTVCLFVALLNVEQSFGQLSGTYTIGGTAPDYPSFGAAISDLTTQGVSAPVIFNVRSNTYTEQLSLVQITGASSVNTITFQSEAGDSSLVILTFAGSAGFANNYTVQLNGTDYVTFSRMTLERSGTLAYTSVVDIGNYSTHNVFFHCVITNDITSGVSANNALVVSNPSATSVDSVNTFTGNRFENGTFGLYYWGSSTVQESGTVISGNVFNNQALYALEAAYERSIQITGNEFTSNVAAFSAAVYLFSCNGTSAVLQNKIDLVSGGLGIYFFQCTGAGGAEFICANNFVHVDGGTQAYGIRCNQCSYMGIYFNSVNITSTAATANNAGLELVTAGSVQNHVMNNILVNQNSKSISINNSAVAQMDYNDLVGTAGNFGSFNGVAQADLTSWQTATGYDMHSVSVNPLFTSAGDLHIGSFSLNAVGIPAGSITVDIDNQLRDVATPDIGADEINPPDNDVGVFSVLSPTDNSCGSNATTVIAIVKNLGATPQSNITVEVQVTGTISTTLTGTIAGPVAVYGIDTVVFSPTLNTIAGDTLNFVIYTSMISDQDHSNDTLSMDSIVIMAIPAAPTFSGSSNVCLGDSVSLNAIFAANNEVYWYAAASGGAYIHKGNPLTVAPTSPTTYYAEVRDTSGGNVGCLRITECELNDVSGGDGDYIEIQNCSGSTLDATGWVVAVSNSNVDPNAVNTLYWNLGVFAPGEIQYRIDVNTSAALYWGQNIMWDASYLGWAMIVDNNGQVVDFVGWDMADTMIQNMTPVVNGFPISIAGVWTGAGVTACAANTSVTRTGSSDNDNLLDWTCVTETKGTQNANLLTPFTTCGAGGCPSIRSSVLVSVFAPPVVQLGNDTIVNLSIMLNAGNSGATYLWSTAATTQTINVTVSGNYWVLITDVNGCQASDTIHVDVVSGINTNTLDNSILFYPNPTNDKVNIQVSFSPGSSNVMISLYDELGRKVLYDEAESSSKTIKVYDLSYLTKGVYYFEFKNDRETLVKKIVKL